MKKFWLKILIMILLVSSTILCIFTAPFILPINPSRYLAEHIDKRNLIVSTPSPRIILLGGSNLAFSVDSKLIEKETGYNVVNFGLAGGLGMRLMINDLEKYLKKDDVVIFSPEYLHFSIMLNGSGPDLVGLISADPVVLTSISSLKQINNIFPQILLLIKIEVKDYISYIRGKNWEVCENNGFCRYNFDSYGDEVAHLFKISPGLINEPSIPETEPSSESIKVISDFVKFAEKKNVKTFYSFPPLLDTEFDKDKIGIMKIYETVKKINGLTVIDSPSDYRLPINLFYDQKYHLTREGRKIRTNLLISKLLKVVPRVKE